MIDLRTPRPAILVTLVASLVLVGLVAVVLVRPLLGGEPGTSELAVSPPATTEHDRTEDVPGEAIAADEPLPLVTYEVVLSRDPFEPVRQASTTGTADETTTTPVGDGSATVPTEERPTDPGTDPGTDATEPTGGSPTTDGCTSDGAVVCDGAAVSLISITESSGSRTATVQVDTSIYEVTGGDTFAGRFRVLSIDERCVELLFGDDRFSLCEGDRVLK